MRGSLGRVSYCSIGCVLLYYLYIGDVACRGVHSSHRVNLRLGVSCWFKFGSCVHINFYIILNSFRSRIKSDSVSRLDKYRVIGLSSDKILPKRFLNHYVWSNVNIEFCICNYSFLPNNIRIWNLAIENLNDFK